MVSNRHMKNLGVPWIARKALARAGAPGKVLLVEGDKGTWTEDMITVVMKRRTVVRLDGSTQEIVHPADGSTIVTRTSVEPPMPLEGAEQCCCHVVVTKYSYEGFGHTQEVRRMLLNGGATYLATNRLTLKSGAVLDAKTYWIRDETK